MTKKRKIIFLTSMTLILTVLALSLFAWYKTYSDMSKYEKAKKDTIKYLEKNEAKLKSEFDDFIISVRENEALLSFSGRGASHYYDGKYYSYGRREKDGCEYIDFNFDDDGNMLGGSYWGIYYFPSDILIEDGSSLKVTNGDGNNIYVTQKLKSCWYFYYHDYDGRINPEEDIVE